jgi:hypothetical protein
MVDFSVRVDVVNGIWAARRRGHGQVGAFVERTGVPRSSAYRWAGEFEALLENGPQELKELRRECEVLRREVLLLRELPRRAVRMSREEQRRFILKAAVVGTSDEDIASLLDAAGGPRLSHQAMHRELAQASAVARVAFEQHFAGVGNVAAADEIFLGESPLLLMVAPLSLLISGLRLGEACTAEAWEPVFAQMKSLEGFGGDGGSALGKAGADAGVPLHADMFHLLRPARTQLASLERKCKAQAKKLAKAEKARQQARRDGDTHATRSAGSHRGHVRHATEKLLDEYCRLGDLLETVEGAFDWTTPEGKVRTASEARALVDKAAKEMKKTAEGRRLAKEVACVQRCKGAFRHLEVLEEGLKMLKLEQVGPDREHALGKLVAETVAWRRVDKDSVSVLEEASSGSLKDEIEISVIKLVDRAIRSSSYVECVNSRIRLVQVARKRLSADFVYLLAVYHNMKPFGRGSVRQGKSPAELARIKLPTDDWLELLELTAKELGQRQAQAA